MRAVWRAIRGHLLSRLRVTEVRLVSFLSTSLRLLLLLLATVDSRRALDAFPSLLLLLVNPSLSLIFCVKLFFSFLCPQGTKISFITQEHHHFNHLCIENGEHALERFSRAREQIFLSAFHRDDLRKHRRHRLLSYKAHLKLKTCNACIN